MHLHLVFYVIGIFFNPQTGDQVQGIAEVSSPAECAQIVNDTRAVDPADQYGYYLTEARCGALVEDENGQIIYNQ